ncbi:5'-nucleotidase [Cohaesibacter marisflavi]|uniref:5'-nucleotidase n=1 Tax=Cohaesibacter marisflavi TaxID=655353 RepID=A0A1I5GWE7_9HYPH|nr:5'-nucleotidase [Cohaesibacter marisflavi]SFO40146.1 5'-nucleotidase [Cohaesibacter marisflavi]
MPYPIEDKLVIAVSSSALFNLEQPDRIFKDEGQEAYKAYQEAHLDEPLSEGYAFSFIQKFLQINEKNSKEKPAEVVVLSRNSPATGKRVFRSIRHYGLEISRAAFLQGKSPYAYIPAFNASLFLSANKQDVKNAIDAGYPAGIVLPNSNIHEEDGDELRIAFDFDGVIADDRSEVVVQELGLSEFHQQEDAQSSIPLFSGPLADFFKKISKLQDIEARKNKEDSSYKRFIRTAIITARNSPAHERVITTLDEWGVSPDETFFLGGMQKSRILEVFKPHMFFDDQRSHLDQNVDGVSLVHIPFGIANR